MELEKHIIDKFKQFLWRPRPRTLLSKEQQKTIRRNLKEYSKIFDEEDEQGRTAADQEQVAQRRRLVDEWNVWRSKVKKQQEERGMVCVAPSQDSKAEKEEIKEWVEELIETIEEVVE